MDGRKVLLGLALAAVTALAGCQTYPLNSDPKNPNPSPPPANATAAKLPAPPPTDVPVAKADKKKKAPSAATCVAMGQFIESEAMAAKNISPLQKQEELDKARRAYQQALQLNPSYMPTYCALGHLYVELGDYERAHATYEQGLKKNPKETPLWFDLGMFHARKKEWDQAITCLSKAVELEPENRQYGNALGFCLARAGRYRESLTVFAKSSGPAVAYYNVGRMLHHNNQDELSRQYLRQAVTLSPNFPEAQQMLASLSVPNSGVVSVGFQTSEPR
jgi:Tfp pilus assembly protein PilF